MPSAIVIGRGRFGSALSGALELAGCSVTVLGGRAAATGDDSISSMLARSGPGTLLLLAVRDDSLSTLATSLSEGIRQVPTETSALHFSGALGVDVLAPLSARGLSIGSCHPLQTFTGSAEDARRFEGIVFAVAGEGAGRSAAECLAHALGGRPVTIPAASRSLYHLAASIGANGLTSVVAVARDALATAGFSPGEALEALGPLLNTALVEALRAGPEAALTGPVARGDEATLQRHRSTLLAWDASRAALLEALLREQRRLSARGTGRGGC